jgi:hypothetical protein
MRRGVGAGAEQIGGAWQCAAIMRLEEPGASGSLVAGSTANTRGEYETPCTEEGCTKGACIACMVLQQS